MEKLHLKIGFAPDEELIEKVLAGETSLFEVLIRRYNPLLYKIARTYGFGHQDAEDLMQDTHFAAYKNLPNFRKTATYKTWITRIHLNGCYHKLHYGAGKYEQPEDIMGRPAQDDPMEKSRTADPAQVVQNRELGRMLERSLQQLPLIYRSVFILREVEGFSVAETANLLGITAVNVKVRSNRAKAMLQQQLEKYYSSAELYEFHLKYCDQLVHHVFDRINNHA